MGMQQPLAHRVRPHRIEEVVGQEHLLGVGKPIYQMVKNNRVTSTILYGSPGIGKTTIASAIAGSVNMPFTELNGVTDGKRDINNVIKRARKEGTTYLLFIDEIHRLTKTQSEPLLPAVEDGTIVLIASTTESVYHSLPSGILSRCTVYELEPLLTNEIIKGLERIVSMEDSGLEEYSFKVDGSAFHHLAESASGDMRTAINNLETVIVSKCQRGNQETVTITVDMIEEIIGKRVLGYNGKDSKYDLMSALQKSIRGSDVNAAMYYLALLIETGDIVSIVRRLGIIAFEDIGLADPSTWSATLAAIGHAEKVGFPEAKIPLANATALLALSPKSNTAYNAINAAMKDVQNERIYPIPRHLRDAHYKDAHKRGNGLGYLFPHDYKTERFGGWVAQQYLPSELVGEEYYVPKHAGNEVELGKMYEILYEHQKQNI